MAKTSQIMREPDYLHALDGGADETTEGRMVRVAVGIGPDLDAELSRVAADLAYFNERVAEAMRDHLLAKGRVELLAATLDPLKRTEVEARGKVTEAAVRAAVLSDLVYQEAAHTEIEAEVRYVAMRGVTEAIRAKRDMLISLCANRRAELLPDRVRKPRDDGGEY